ncbi:MAG TPA: hypothetical protein VM537_18355 [Anaerolineae bacterium]|nr:hypothetical protein [Anaerolineae bacterium]
MAVVRYTNMHVARSSGRLVKVPVRPGVMILMYEEEAIRRGLIPAPAGKAQGPVANKKRQPASNK